MQRVLVTGGAGFIGSELVHQLAARGFIVRVVDNLVNGRRENLRTLLGGNVELVVADVRDTASMAALFRGVDLVFHMATLGVRHSIHSPLENHEVNAAATLGLLQAARSAGVGRFVQISSSEVYGTARVTPITEDHPTQPMTVYGASKLAAESYARAFWNTYRYPTVVLRPFNSYGPRCHHEGDSGEVIPKFLLRCLAGRPMVIFGDGKQTRDLTHVRDTAAGILAAGLSEACVGQTINIGSGAEISILELARTIAQVTGKPSASVVHVEPRPGDVLRLSCGNSKARSLLKFAPTVTLSEGIAQLRDWYLGLEESPEQLLEHEVVRNWELQEVVTHA